MAANTKNGPKGGWLAGVVITIVVILAIKIGGSAITEAFGPKLPVATTEVDKAIKTTPDDAEKIIRDKTDRRPPS